MTPQRQHYKDITTLGLQGLEGEILSSYCSYSGLQWLTDLPEHLTTLQNDQLLYRQRNSVYRVADPLGGKDLCIKAFKTPDALRSLIYRKQGSKAQRAHQYARHLYQHHAAVNEPIGYIERWNGNQLVESYLINRYLDQASDLYTEMTYVLRESPYASHFVHLLRIAAEAVKSMHDSGFIHGDLGPQNILLTRAGPYDWENPIFIDLNRGRLQPNPTLRQRAKDMERLKIPTHFLRIFQHIYFNDSDIPKEFSVWAERYRLRFYWHQKSRKYRHPIKTLTQWLKPEPDNKKHQSTGQPSPRDVWLWDEFSAQPSVMLQKRERNLERRKRDVWITLWQCICAAPSILGHYRARKALAFHVPISMKHRFGVSVEIDNDFEKQRQQLLVIRGGANLLIRCYFHLGLPHINTCEQAIAALKKDGHSVSLSIIQSRSSVTQPELWATFVETALERLHHMIDCVEIGHAINRVKWGLWNLEEINSLWTRQNNWRTKYPNLIFLGPAVNDFEYQYYPPLMAKNAHLFDALSGHLYVDRRGAPENKQARWFSTLEKTLLARSIADAYHKTGYYITEVNWPIKNTGLYSPLAGAYQLSATSESPLHVTESDSAAFMIRYALISLCSSAANGIWWWCLAHPGFGLIDNESGWRERSGWNAFVTFQTELGSCTFLEREERDQVIWWHFTRSHTNDTLDPQKDISVAYSLKETTIVMPAGYKRRLDITGESLPCSLGQHIDINDSPQYFLLR